VGWFCWGVWVSSCFWVLRVFFLSSLFFSYFGVLLYTFCMLRGAYRFSKNFFFFKKKKKKKKKKKDNNTYECLYKLSTLYVGYSSFQYGIGVLQFQLCTTLLCWQTGVRHCWHSKLMVSRGSTNKRGFKLWKVIF